MSEAVVLSQDDILQRTAARSANTPLTREAIRVQLERILNSKAFARSPRISRFLSFVVDQTLDGQENKLKEYLLGVEVFGRLDTFDPRIDSIVRVEARRLRYKLENYYASEGPEDPIHIQFRKGCYVPAFSERRPGDQAGDGELGDMPYVRPIADPHAFALYARGRYCLGRWTPDGIAEAVSCFTHALAEDENCAGAHAGLASAWMFSALLGVMPARDVVPKSKSSALRALAIMPQCSEAHSVLGIASAVYDREWAEAEGKLRRGIHANPCSPGARLWYGLYLTLAGRAEEASVEMRRAQQAAPTSLSAHLAAGFASHAARSYDDALTQYRLAQDLDPTFYPSYVAMGLLFADQSMNEQAMNMLNRASQIARRDPLLMAVTAYAHAAAGRTDACSQILNEMNATARTQYVPPFTMALAESAAGNVDAAFRKLDEAVEERSAWLPVARFAPAFEQVRRDPRFPGLLSQINLA